MDADNKLMRKFYITTAIPYVNAPPHIGHALEFVQTDVLARYHRIKGEDSFFTTGADENALKNVQAAEKAGVSTQELVDKNAQLFIDFAKKLNIDYQGFDRGSDKETHWPGAVELWKRCEESGDIYKKSYRGLYCVGCERFLTEKELEDGLCPDHKTEPEEVEEENYFFKLSKYQKELEKIIQSNEYEIVPKTRKNEVLSFIKEGLEDFSISRSKERAKGWGIPVPGDDSQVMYVWFDALGIYLTAIGFGLPVGEKEEKFNKYWPADVHVIGKDIIRFHAVYWPAILLSAGLELPKKLLVHGFINIDGQKMSKTIGNIVEPLALVEKYSVDALRYYLLAEIPTTEDGNFSEKRFKERYNADLANGLGNLTARILTLTQNMGGKTSGVGESAGGGGRTPEVEEDLANDSEIAKKIKESWSKYNNSFEELDLKKAIEGVWELIRILDRYVEEKKPWENRDEKVLQTLLFGLANVASLVRPFLPGTSNKIFKGLGVSPEDKEWNFKPQKIEPLFPRLND